MAHGVAVLTTTALIVVMTWSVLASDHRQDLIQDSVRRLLGVKPGSEQVPGRNTSHLPPQYVMDLYERYRSGHAPMQGNTVRSILPLREEIGEADLLIFNLSSIGSEEQILQSKLYILKRKKPKSGRKRDHSGNFRMKIGNLPQMTSHRFVDVSLSNRRSQWHSYDITESVVQCRHDKKDGDHLLGVTLEIKRAKGSYRIAPFRRLLKHNSQPFVLIFSDDGNNQTRGPPKMNSQNGIQDLLRSKVEHDASSATDYFSDQDDSSEYSSSIDIRGKRSIDDNNDVLTSLHARKKLSQKELGDNKNNLNSELLKDISAHTVMDTSVGDTKILFSQMINLSTTNNLKTLLDGEISNSNFRTQIHKAISNTVSVANASENSRIKNTSKVLLNNVLSEDSQFKNSIMYANSIHQRTKRRTSSKESVEQSKEQTNTVQSAEDKSGLNSDKKSGLNSDKKSGLNSDKNSGLNSDKKSGLNSDKKSGLNSDKTSRRRDRKKDRTSTRKLKKTKRRRHRKLPFWWTRHANKFHSKDHRNMCQRKSLVVDFVKLGWGEWVMSPKSFNAYYCSGGCKFPLTKDSHPSNHAAIQSLVYALGGSNPGIPSPCCVPSHTSSLTMLYFDEQGSLVLKSFSDMIVDKCACR
ncbi:hypothetical protein JTE90_026006 [Oedothorax gibbosus]|uniref:TGF-beta family profile domain-containing protein n=1 Tax=Oedothorax gibbosus TaxID=931172 RepID=A0AAV6UGS2_9ARAC|nr:hypothetical protein JTE90_026006 [Oedothorax gibbosus]